jgi:O-acetylhomoserine (thiol)-lyase
MENWKFATKTIQAGYTPKDGEPRILPIVQSTTFKYDDAQSVADLFDLKREGFFYSRLANPTVDAFEKKMAVLEKGVAAVALNAGQAANAFAIMNIAQAGDHVLAASGLYGGTVSLFTNTLIKSGIEVSFFDTNICVEELAKLIRPNTKAIFAESLANPALIVADFEVYAKVAHDNQIPLIIDNTFPTPFFCNPFDFGADIVTHSTTKYIDGHATSVGGVVIEKGDFDWASSGKFPGMTEPDESYHGLIYTKDFAACPFSVKLRVQAVRDLGISMAPLNAFLSNLGLETLHVRMERHDENALKLAEFLKNHPKVAWVNYPGLSDSPEQKKVAKYLRGASGVLTFGAKGGREASEKVMNSLKLAAIVVHVADVRTGVLHPASMTHRQLKDSELIAAGITPDLVRVSVGIEDIDDIIADFDQALAQI